MANDLRGGLQRAEAELEAVEMPKAMNFRLRQRLLPRARRGNPGRRRVALLVALGAGAALVVFAVSRPQKLGPFEVAGASPDFVARLEAGVITIEAGRATLLDAARGGQLAVEAPARLQDEAGGVRVLAGTIAFSVEHRAERVTRTLVSDGQIEVFGTRFLVAQGRSGGSVSLLEGSIRFLATDGRSRVLAVGQTLHWPLPPDPPADGATRQPPELVAPVQSPSRQPPRRRDRLEPPAEPDELLREVEVLRSRGEHGEAVRYLAVGLGRPLPAASRERFSFELGSLLTWQLRDFGRACPHWRLHLERFPAGRYVREVDRAREAAGCGAAP